MKTSLFMGAVAALVVASASAGEPTPEGTAMAFYVLANQGKCELAEELFTADSLEMLRASSRDGRGFARFCDARGGDSPLLALKIKFNSRAGDRAEVEILRTYVNGVVSERDILLAHESDWRMVVHPDAPATLNLR